MGVPPTPPGGKPPHPPLWPFFILFIVDTLGLRYKGGRGGNPQGGVGHMGLGTPIHLIQG